MTAYRPSDEDPLAVDTAILRQTGAWRTVAELAELTGYSPAAVEAAVRRLEQHGQLGADTEGGERVYHAQDRPPGE